MVLGDRLTGLSRFLADEGHRLFVDDCFADLYVRSRLGRPTVPARALATVMVLQAFEGLSDREAVDRLGRDLAWQAACGVDTGYGAFHSTVLVGVRNRLRASGRPKRFLDDTRDHARESGVMRDRVRVLDSTPIYDAVTTEDTITRLRAAIRKMLAALRSDDPALAVAARSACRRDGDYLTAGRPVCDWDDREAKDQLVYALVRDARSVLDVLHSMVRCWPARLVTPPNSSRSWPAKTSKRAVTAGSGSCGPSRGIGSFRPLTLEPGTLASPAVGISMATKGHVSIDPDSEIIDDVTVAPANAADQDAVDDLLQLTPDDTDGTEVSPNHAPTLSTSRPLWASPHTPMQSSVKADRYGRLRTRRCRVP